MPPLLVRHLLEFDHFGVAPEALQIVKLPLLLVEDVNHHVAVVQQYPAGVGIALHVVRMAPILLPHLLRDLVDDSLDLDAAGTVADDKVVRNGTDRADIENDHLLSTLVIGCQGCQTGQFGACQPGIPLSQTCLTYLYFSVFIQGRQVPPYSGRRSFRPWLRFRSAPGGRAANFACGRLPGAGTARG